VEAQAVKFTIDDRSIEFEDGRLSGDKALIATVLTAVEDRNECGCNFWGEIPADLGTDWSAYLTICGAIRNRFGEEPVVDLVPDNPAGYEPEGVTDGPVYTFSTTEYAK